ncbi:MAG: hypothetical protein JRD05_13465 [Deltaproteobacteria bacterium]|nr:hypothetical protein [Deltaproteobacteria bacterium]
MEPSKRENNKDQQKQAAHAISIFHEIRRPNSNKKGNKEARTIKNRLPPANTIERLLTKLMGHRFIMTWQKRRFTLQ